jgi:putative FmdB family regulatory protein
MPTYDYLCDDCGHQFEAFQSMKDDALTTCPECEAPALRRLITGGTGVIFRGSGFYVNDSKGRSTRNTEKKTETSPATDSSTTAASGGSEGSTSTKSEGAKGDGPSSTPPPPTDKKTA